jgi:N-acetyl-gamma-glutamylphosphate reductase
MYEYTDDTNDTLAVAVYPVAAWTTTSLDTALTAAVEGCTVTATATFTG